MLTPVERVIGKIPIDEDWFRPARVIAPYLGSFTVFAIVILRKMVTKYPSIHPETSPTHL